MAIRIKRSAGDNAPATLAAGQLAYAEGTTNGGTLYFGEIGGVVREIGGKKIVDKVNGIEAGAQVNTVTSVATRTGDVVITSTDLADFSTAADARIGLAEIQDLANVTIPVTPGNGQVLTWNNANSYWEAQAAAEGVTEFTALNDTPNAFTGAGGYWLRVNAAGNAVEFTQDTDDGTF